MAKQIRLMAACGLAMSVAAVAVAVAAPFQPGNVVVHQVGDGTATLSSAASATFLVEINPATGVIVQTIALPTASATSGNRALNQSGTATSEGAVTLSTNGQFLLVVGYNADLGTPSVAGTQSATVNRVIGVIDCQGVVDSTTAFEGFNANNIRAAASTDGTDLWAVGAGGGTAANTIGGARYIQRGSTTAVSLNFVEGGTNSPPTNMRYVNIFDGQLYATSASGAFQGVMTVGTGLPTTAGQTMTMLPGLPTTIGPSAYDFFLADASTLYVADDRAATSGGGIQKWVLNAGTWTLEYTLNTGITTGVRGLAGVRDAGTGQVTLLATTATANGNAGNALVRVVDSGATSEFTTILTSGANRWWRGVDFAPVCAVPVCYANCDGSTGTPALTPADFVCFLNKFRAGDPYANCDGSTGTPALTPADFVCFLNKFRAGC